VAKLYFRYGAMNCGKTTVLIQAAFNYEERGMRVLVLKPAVDTKGGDVVRSRLGVERKADALVHVGDSIPELLGDTADVSCVLVDEAQFLTPTQVEELFWLTTEQDIPVLAYGLRTDFLTHGFPGSSRLLELAHELQELKTICRCGRKAVLTGRKLNGEFVREGNQVAIEDQAHIEYESLCAIDYKKLVLDQTTSSSA
jgi:thymidine kinase